jgi:hypothetical protein
VFVSSLETVDVALAGGVFVSSLETVDVALAWASAVHRLG